MKYKLTYIYSSTTQFTEILLWLDSLRFFPGQRQVR